MKMKKSEILDRFSILSMKLHHDLSIITESSKYAEETSRIMDSVKSREKHITLLLLFSRLMEINAKIWMLEAAIRKEFENDPAAKMGKEISFEEIGRTAIEIRNYNAIRVQTKNEIDEFFGESPDVKIDHVSASENYENVTNLVSYDEGGHKITL